MARWILRKAVPADIDKIKSIEERVQPCPWSKEGLLREINEKSGKTHFWCICPSTNTSEILGYICFRILGRECYLLNISVDKSCQGKGIGRLLFRFMIKFLDRRKVQRLALDVHKENQEAMSFYSMQGLSLAAPLGEVRGNFCVMEMKLFQE